MSDVFGALAPIFLLILFGQLLRRRRMLPESFWPSADRLTYFLFFPCLIVDELARADIGAEVAGMAAAMVTGVLASAALVLAARPLMRMDGPAFSSVFQGSVRPNTYVGLAASKTLYGSAGLGLTAVGIAVVVPLVNVLCVVVMTRFGRDSRGTGVRAVLNGLVRNPIIVAVAIGALLNLTGIGRPPVLGSVVELLARAALPVGLLSVGAGLDFGAARAAGAGVALAASAKLLLVPVATGLAGMALGIDALMVTIAVLFNALPCSASAYALARQMGGDTGLIAGIITVQTMLAALTLPLLLVLF
ncbi:AEC family transporter [Azospirillum sp. SYSU D00513]|uniref:AEC family transporter n=1 Tax=Azospirillum sp. SYSU D00513 TaxID=2812561 RepID=UPI001A963521|nr:AEC family transporter [Azospirillum sp. SYSU D00513]